jgi:hypothetical protein
MDKWEMPILPAPIIATFIIDYLLINVSISINSLIRVNVSYYNPSI